MKIPEFVHIGAVVLWHSAKGFTPPAGEVGTISAIWPDKRCARLELDVPELAADPHFRGKVSVIAYFDEISLTEDNPE